MIDSWGLLPDAIRIRAIGHEVYSHAEPDHGGRAPPPWWVLGIVARIVPSLRRKLRISKQAIDQGKLQSTPPRWESEFKPELIQGINGFAGIDLPALDDTQLFEHLDRLKSFQDRAAAIHFELFVPYVIGLHGLATTCEKLLGWNASQTMHLLQGLSVASSAPTRKLEQIAEVARTRPAARAVIEAGGADFFERLNQADAELGSMMAKYLRHWGLRTIEYDAGSTSLREQPELLAGLLLDLLEPREVTATPQVKRDKAVAEARAQLTAPDDRRRFDEALAYAELVYPQREDNVLYTDNLPSGLFRLVALELGRRLVAQGRLKCTQEAVLLTEEQLREALSDRTLDTAAIAARVRSEMAWVRANPGPLVYGPEAGPMPNVRGLPEPARRLNGALLWAMAEELAPAKTRCDGEISGLPSSPGVAVGTVRVVRSSSEIHRVRQGDVVVCPATSPAWTVIFQRAAAIVADGGSALCHAAIVAREHGIPAVVATGNGTARLRDGQRVRVDGNRGTVVVQGD
jgi:pyruvate,water dikinase